MQHFNVIDDSALSDMDVEAMLGKIFTEPEKLTKMAATVREVLATQVDPTEASITQGLLHCKQLELVRVLMDFVALDTCEMVELASAGTKVPQKFVQPVLEA